MVGPSIHGCYREVSVRIVDTEISVAPCNNAGLRLSNSWIDGINGSERVMLEHNLGVCRASTSFVHAACADPVMVGSRSSPIQA